MKIKVAELEGARLDYWVGIAEGLLVEIKSGACFRETSFGKHEYSPSTDWSQGGPILERERIKLDSYPWEEGAIYWKACTPSQINKNYCSAKTPLIAAMRCYVSSKFGEEV